MGLQSLQHPCKDYVSWREITDQKRFAFRISPSQSKGLGLDAGAGGGGQVGWCQKNILERFLHRYSSVVTTQLSLILSLIPRLLLVCTCQLHPFIHSLLSLTEKEEAVELKEREFFYGNHWKSGTSFTVIIWWFFHISNPATVNRKGLSTSLVLTRIFWGGFLRYP